MTTHGRTGSSSSDTSACSGWLWIGSRSPAIDASTDECPAAARATSPASIGPSVVSTPATRPSRDRDPRDLTALDHVDAQPIRAAREGPRDVVVLRDAAARLVRRAEHGIPDMVARLDDRADLLDAVRVDPLRVDAAEAVGVHAAAALAHVAEAVREVQDAALAEQDVVVELLLEPLPELQRVLVDRRALVPEVVRADDRRVAAHVAAAEPPALEHRDIGDAVLAAR